MLKVVIDPACGGRVLGHQSPRICEKDYVLELSKKQKALLLEQGMDVVLTRDMDQDLDADKRAAVTSGADVLISNRLNAGQKRGVEICYPLTQDSSFAEKLAAKFSIHGFLVRRCYCLADLSDPHRDYDALLEKSQAKKSVLIYYGYVDSGDADILLSSQDEFCAIVLEAIQEKQG